MFDPSTIQITDEAYPGRRAMTRAGKYAAVAARLKIGQRIVCPQGVRTGTVANGIKKELQRLGYVDIDIRTRRNAGDGLGGVWWMGGVKAADKLRTVWRTPNGRAPEAAAASTRKRA